MTISALSANTIYYFAMKTYDEVPNTSGLSNVTNFPTAVPPSTSIPSAGPSGVVLDRVAFYGQAYPQSTLAITRNSATDRMVKQNPFESIIINNDGSFRIIYDGLSRDNYFFTIKAIDKTGVSGALSAFSVPVQSVLYELRDILLAPTLSFEKSSVAKNAIVKVKGYAVPSYVVELEVDGSKYRDSKSDATGLWSFDIDTAYLSYGEHRARVAHISPDGKTKSFSLSRTFKIVQFVVSKSDFNNDGTIDIRDWSIFLFRWGNIDQNVKIQADLNDDNKVDIFDFSIFLQSIK